MREGDRAATGPRSASIGVFIVTPIRLYRQGIAHYLAASGAVSVLGTAEESESTLSRALELRPDVILLDMALRESRAIARALHHALPDASILAVAVPESEQHVLACAEAGIAGYVPLEGTLEELLTAVLSAADGEAVCSPRIAAGLFRRVADLSSRGNEPQTREQQAPKPSLSEISAKLTAREWDVLSLLEDGRSNKQIALRLVIELPTAKNHVHSI